MGELDDPSKQADPSGRVEDPDSGTLRVIQDVESRLDSELPTLPAGQKSEVTRVVREIIREAHFSGPYPPPELLGQYEKISPGAAQQILAMGLDEQRHRHDCDRRELEQRDRLIDSDKGAATYSLIALFLGFTAFLVISGIGVYALRLGYPATAGICFTTFALGIVGTLVKGRNSLAKHEPRNAKPELARSDDSASPPG